MEEAEELFIMDAFEKWSDFIRRSKKQKIFSPKDLQAGFAAVLAPVKKEAIDYPGSLFEMVQSSNLLTVSYYKKKKWLEIEFVGGGKYRYYQVNIQVYYNLLKAQSHGKYFWRRIRRQPYRYRKIA